MDWKLSFCEARVLGCLLEKEMTTPGSSTFSVVHCGGDVEFTDGEVEHGD